MTRSNSNQPAAATDDSPPVPPMLLTATHAHQLAQLACEPAVWASAINTHRRTIVGVSFGRQLFQRMHGVGRPARWGQTIAARFVVGKLRPDAVSLTLSPYLPPQQQLRSSRG